MSNIRPLEDRILVKPLDAETKTASGLFLPESAKEKPMQGKVVATGPGKLLDNGTRQTPLVKRVTPLCTENIPAPKLKSKTPSTSLFVRVNFWESLKAKSHT